MIALLEPFMDNQTLLLIAIMLLVMAVGTAMDMTPTILILTPVLMPVVKAAGIDPVYFGVLFIMNNAIGLVTPPVGTVLNVVAGVGKMKMDEVTRGVLPFMIAQFIVMFLLVLFPVAGAGAGALVRRLNPAGAASPGAPPAAGNRFRERHRIPDDRYKETVDELSRPAPGHRGAGRAAAAGAALAQDIKERTIKFALQNPKGHPLELGTKKFAELVAAKSGGKIKVNLFPGGTLGGDAAERLGAAGRHDRVVVLLNAGILASQVKDFAVFDFPFLFANAKEADAVVDGPFGREAARQAARTRASSAWPTGSWAFATSPTASARSTRSRTSTA